MCSADWENSAFDDHPRALYYLISHLDQTQKITTRAWRGWLFFYILHQSSHIIRRATKRHLANSTTVFSCAARGEKKDAFDRVRCRWCPEIQWATSHSNHNMLERGGGSHGGSLQGLDSVWRTLRAWWRTDTASSAPRKYLHFIFPSSVSTASTFVAILRRSSTNALQRGVLNGRAITCYCIYMYTYKIVV